MAVDTGSRDKHIHAELLAFLERQGVSLEQFGSGELGLRLIDAVSFLNLLSEGGAWVLGLEPWRKCGDVYRVDTLAVWAAGCSDRDGDHIEAKHCLQQFALGPEDVVTIQFRALAV